MLYTRNQFAELTGKSPQQIGVCIKRDGTVVEENKKIDLKDPVNKAYLAKVTALEVSQSIAAEVSVNQTPNTEKHANLKTYTSVASTIDYEKKSAEIVKIQADIKLKELEYAKKMKKVIPLALASTNINTFLIGTVGKVKNGLDEFIDDHFENEEALKYKKEIHYIIELSIKSNLKTAINEMEKEAEEYSLAAGW